jgi:6-phosphogluconolactonase
VVPDVPAAFAALVARERPATVALSGGTTARDCYEAVDDLPGATVLFGDERWVPVDHPDSHAGMARRALLDRSTVACIHSMRGAGDDIEAAARSYDAVVRSLPPVAMVHLGLGPDGHTASLFPGSPQLDVRDCRATGGPAGLEPFVDRVTMTIPMLNAARTVVFLVAGAAKAEAVRRAFGDPPDPATPSSLVRSESGSTVAILDREAASLLDI